MQTIRYTLLIFSIILSLKIFAQDCDASFTYKITAGIRIVDFKAIKTDSNLHYQWYIEDTLIDSKPQFTYFFEEQGIYNVCLNVSNDTPFCSSQFCKLINVEADDSCRAIAAVKQLDTSTFFFSGSSSPDSTSYYWEVDNSFIKNDSAFKFFFSDTGSHKAVFFVDNNGCIAKDSITLFLEEVGTCKPGFLSSIRNDSVVYSLQADTQNISYYWVYNSDSIFKKNFKITHQDDSIFSICLYFRDTVSCCFDSLCDVLLKKVIDTIYYTLPSNETIYYYPNPAENIINFKVENLNNSPISAFIYDGAGRLKMSYYNLIKTQLTINIENLDAGFYYMFIKQNNRLAASGHFHKI